MRIALIIAGLLSLIVVSTNQAYVRQDSRPTDSAAVELYRGELQIIEKGTSLEERWRQVPAIAAAFARRTDEKRAWHLAKLCYLKTLGTTFIPLDLAEIALAETGGHGLVGKSVSPRGALGVWQLMPVRAKSHGYAPEEMADDAKCADAAVRELLCKMAMAGGNLPLAKRYYCGTGAEARMYAVRIRQYHRELMSEMQSLTTRQAVIGINQFPS
ncbi:hypothetical protein JN12_00686 [Geobacter argillaceus]|uniref:Transglycosylase-like protein with SLT domain n=1 Tax=Geobacter argillaceus TaxID=345631 RepID=A0A562WRH0_9BACT|nr:lytic transglycosylase domain-containing protein [Geobacter argillaceus]TWJ32711.1 hypothetical protein JN12_00686 [Geobacter argillaceus]